MQFHEQTVQIEFEMHSLLKCVSLLMLLMCVHCYQQEPRCSKFDFEEKVLEKMVRMEHKMELMEEKNKELKTQISRDLDKCKEIQERQEEGKSQPQKTMTDQRSYSFSAFWIANISPSRGDALVFTDTQLDEDGIYNNATGKLTAPVAGMYMFSSTICTYNNKKIRLDFVVDEMMIGRLSSHHTGWSGCSSGSATARISKGSKVWMKVIYTSSGRVFDNNKSYTINSFSGHLLQKSAG